MLVRGSHSAAVLGRACGSRTRSRACECALAVTLTLVLLLGAPLIAHGTTDVDATTHVSPRILPTALADAYEPDDSLASAKAIVVDGAPQRRTLYPEGDQDWISFVASGGWAYTIETAADTPPDDVDTYLYLYDSDGTTLLDSDDDGGDGFYSRIEYSVHETKTLYARVTGYSDDDVGAYTLSVTRASSPVGRITGTVTDGSTSIEGVEVWWYVWDGEYWVQQPWSVTTGSDGTYEIVDLEPDTYRVGFEPDYPYFDEFYDGKASVTTADDVVVSAGATTSGIDATLESYGRITGTVIDGVVPIDSVEVDCYRYDPATGWLIYRTDYTGDDGVYTLWGLMPGESYRLRFRHSGGEYLIEWYDDASQFASATNVFVGSGQAVTANAVLAPAGRIFGSVTADGFPAGGVLVEAYHWDASHGYGIFAGGRYTSGDGTYFIGSLPTGTYRVKFDDGAGPYPVEWWDNVATIEVADDVAVVAGQDRVGISAVLGGVSSNSPPVLGPIGAKAVNELALLSFTATATDADDDPLTFTLGAGAPAGAAITAGGEFTWTPTEAQGPGSYPITIIVSDGQGGTDSETFAVTVNEVNVPPVLDPVDGRTVNELELLVFTVTATDADIPANTLTFSLGAGAPAGAAITAGGEFTWTPTEAQGPGSHPITIIVSDGQGGTDSETFTVKVIDPAAPNVPPVATNDSYSTPFGTALTVPAPGVLANDDDPDGDNASLTAVLVSGPATGVLALGGSGGFTYTPAVGFSGMVTFTYRASDGEDVSDIATVSITVQPKPDDPVTPLAGVISGPTRYATAIAGSKSAYPKGAPAVVIATGEHFADALGGAGLAGALDSPLLLTEKASLPGPVMTEIGRLEAKKAYILGGTGAVSGQVESALKARLGERNVIRIAGANRYQTADRVAAETIKVLDSKDGYTGDAFVATGANFPDALAAGPVLGSRDAVMLLTDGATVPTSTRSALSTNRAKITRVTFFGGDAAVPPGVRTTVNNLIR